MARVVRETETVTRNDADQMVRPGAVNDPADAPSLVAARIVYIIGGLIMGLLALRFLLSLLGANRENAFADLIYGLSFPFAAPFFGLFNYDATYGRSRFEFETLFAIAVYALLTWFIVRLLTVRRDTV